MDRNYDAIRRFLDGVRTRWRLARLFRSLARAAFAAAAILTLALLAVPMASRAPASLAAVAIAALVLTIGALVWGLRSARESPSDKQIARLVEECLPELDDRLVSAVDVMTAGERPPSGALVAPMLADASASIGDVDLDRVVSGAGLRRGGATALAAVVFFGVVGYLGRGPIRDGYDAASLVLFPSRVSLAVTPGDARVRAGSPLAIEAALVGNRAPLAAEVQFADGDAWRVAAMSRSEPGKYRLALDSVTAPFKYRVVAGALTSSTYAVVVARPPKVARVDVDYTYPPSLGLKPKTEEDAGDVYAPAGTAVRLRVHTDRPASTGRLTFGDGATADLAGDTPTLFSATLQVRADTSYRIALADRDGLSEAGDTEYFIRVLEDRPPDVHIVRPASDRSVTPLEEVDVEAQADDDYGLDKMELVYSVRGGAEQVVALPVPPKATSVTARRTLFLEDLNVQPGDFVSYYVRARDITRGARANEARSDIFFLEVKPFEQEFSLAQSQSMSGSGYNGLIDELVNAQKQVVVATWKLDRRAKVLKGAESANDIRAVGKTEADLKSRVERTSSSFRESTMRDPRRRTPQPSVPREEEEEMAAAAGAMSQAVDSLQALQTSNALPPEMEALNYLLRAQAAVKKRQVQMQQAGAGAAGNANRNYDISTLFDKELRRSQQTSYETPNAAGQKDDPHANDVDKIKELAKRQDELLKKQQDLANRRNELSDDALRRELEKLTREQSELRQKAEEMASQMASRQSSGGGSQGEKKGEQKGEPKGEKSGGGSSGSAGGKEMQDASEAMRDAASDLRRQDPRQAAASGNRALQKLRDLERQLDRGGMDDKRRAVGDAQLEARQLADAERQLASELAKEGAGTPSGDAKRRMAGEQERLADRVTRLQDRLKREAGGAGDAGAASKDLERERVEERLRQSARDLRNGADARPGAAQEIARSLDRAADRMSGAGGDGKDGESRKLSEQLARTQELRERLENTSRELGKLGGPPDGSKPGGSKPGAANGGSSADTSRLQQESARQMQEARALLEQLKREDPNIGKQGAGVTFEGQGMVFSAPGTEAFKQDFAKWEALKKQATLALQTAETSLSSRLHAAQARDRLAAGGADRPPAQYQEQVDSYFKALAKKKPQ